MFGNINISPTDSATNLWEVWYFILHTDYILILCEIFQPSPKTQPSCVPEYSQSVHLWFGSLRDQYSLYFPDKNISLETLCLPANC